MKGIESLVPGFAAMLSDGAAAGVAWHDLAESVPLAPRELALVSLGVAARSGGAYSRWVTERLARRAGLDGEEILLASAGTALRPRDRDLVRAAECVAGGGKGPDSLVRAVTLARLECAILDNLAPTGDSAPAPRGA